MQNSKIAYRPRGEDDRYEQETKPELVGGSRLPCGPAQQGQKSRHQRGVHQHPQATIGSHAQPPTPFRLARTTYGQRGHAGQQQGRQAGLPKHRRQPKQRWRQRPEGSRQVGRRRSEHLPGELHHHGHSQNGEEGLQRHDDDGAGRGVTAEETENGAQQSGVSGRQEGGRSGRSSKRGAQTVTGGDRRGQKSQVWRFAEEPIARIAANHHPHHAEA
jgi:hypothetical protein